MAVTHDDLLQAIETSLFIYPPTPGIVDPLGVPGVVARVTPVSHPLANLVGVAQLRPDTADDVIAAVRDAYAVQDKAAGWVVGPLSTPADLGERLRTAGFIKADEMAGMALTDLDHPIPANPAVHVWEAGPDELMAATPMIAQAYGLPLEVAQFVNKMALAGVDRIRIRAYLAALGDDPAPVAFGNLVYLSGGPIVLLGGAATLPHARGHGVYSALVARRLADARAGGAEAAVIQAVRSSSAPICQSLGFTELCNLDFYAWLPPSMRGEAAHA